MNTTKALLFGLLIVITIILVVTNRYRVIPTDINGETSDTLDTTVNPKSTPVKVVITANSIKLSPRNIVVNQGDQVQLTLKSVSGLHQLVIDGLSITTPDIYDNQSQTVTFVAAKKGTFQYYCKYHKDMGMTGNLIVR